MHRKTESLVLHSLGYQGKDTIASFYYEGKLPHYIRQQLRINENQFNAIKDCTIERDGHIKILTDKGIV